LFAISCVKIEKELEEEFEEWDRGFSQIYKKLGGLT
jgi:hypothetical protein